jgi:hypothetical protein
VSRNLLRELSPREETTLRRIAQGASMADGLRYDDIVRLEKFGLAETAGGVVTLTPLGAQRVALMTRSTNSVR